MDCRRELHKGDTAWDRDLVQVRDKPRAHCWDKEWRNGSENNPKTGTDETLRNIIVARDTGSALGHGTNALRRGGRKKHLILAPASPPLYENQTDDK